MISKDFSEDVTIIAKFKGQGSVGVVWEHNGKELNCSSELDDDDIECTITSGHTSDYDYQVRLCPYFIKEDVYCMLHHTDIVIRYALCDGKRVCLQSKVSLNAQFGFLLQMIHMVQL